jgi:hypothetical protein
MDRILLPIALGPLLVACGGAGAASDTSSYLAAPAEADEDGGGGAADTGAGGSRRWWRLRAGFEIVSGRPQAAGAALGLSWVSDDGEVICEGVAPVEAVEVRSVPDPQLLAWWGFTPGEWVSDCDGALGQAPLTAPFLLGVGALDAEIVAQVEGTGEPAADLPLDRLNGAWFQGGEGAPLWVYGLAGAAGAWAGEAGPAEAAPLTSGAWTLEPAFSFP